MVHVDTAASASNITEQHKKTMSNFLRPHQGKKYRDVQAI